MSTKQFDRLDAYRTAIRYVGQTRALVVSLRTTDPVLADQLHRCVLSVPLNIAEGAGEFSAGDKRRFYRYALRSATESIAVLDVCAEIGLLDAGDWSLCRETGMRIVAMLTRLVLVMSDRDGKDVRDRGPGGKKPQR
jgi:four helix bundle protein